LIGNYSTNDYTKLRKNWPVSPYSEIIFFQDVFKNITIKPRFLLAD